LNITVESADLERLNTQLQYAKDKWQRYEDEFILPTFKWARQVGFDLQRAVRESPGDNCVKLLVDHLRAQIVKRDAEIARLQGMADG
jgi:hypothetical protein